LRFIGCVWGGWDQNVPDRILVEQRKSWLADLVDAVGQATQPGMGGEEVKAVYFVGFSCESDPDHHDLKRRLTG
jgi:hypothetical protein